MGIGRSSFFEVSSIDSTVSYDCGTHLIRKSCIHDCSKWTLRIDQIQKNFSTVNKAAVVKELSYSPASERCSKLFERPVKIQCDLLTDMCARENLQWVFNMQLDQISQFED